MKDDWEFDREAFDNFLRWLHPDRDEAGRKYEEIRCKLIRFFTCRGCCDPEGLTDETITRVIRQIQPKTAEYKGEPIAFFYAVGKNVYREEGRIRLPAPEDLLIFEGTNREIELACLESCMETISQINRQLISRYSQQERREKIKARRLLADELGLEINALRIQACRIRKTLRNCVSSCIARKIA